MKKYVSYIRVSTDKQEDSGLGIEAQKKINSNYIKNVNGELIKEVVEIETGTNKNRISIKQNLNLETLLDKRPLLQKLIEFCQKESATLVVKDLSRLGRNQLLISYLMQAGIDFVCADSPNDTPFILQIKAAVYEDEARLISKRTIEALDAKKARGEKLGNPNIATVKRPGNQKAFRDSLRYYNQYKKLILDLFSSHKNYSYVASELNRMGFKTKNNSVYYADTIKGIIERFKKSEELQCVQ